MAMQQNLYGMLTMSTIRKKAFENKIPIHATFELTPRCNFNCQMCYVHLSNDVISKFGRELTAQEWLDIGRQAAEMGVLSICITGGEPLLHPGFNEIWIGLSQMGFRLILQTNASLISDEILKLFEEYPPDTVKITLYGSNNEIYKKVCKINNGFDRVDKGIKALQNKGYLIQLVTTFINQNKDDSYNLAVYAKENNLPWYYSSACYPSLRGANNNVSECAINPFDDACIEEKINEWKNFFLITDDIKPAQMCSAYQTQFSISWNGEMRFCLFLNIPNISVFDFPLVKCWDKLLLFWSQIKWPNECYKCDVRYECRRCIAKLACQSGRLGKVNQSYCNQIKKLIKRKNGGKK